MQKERAQSDTKMQQDAVMTWAPVAHEGEEKPSPRSAHSLVQNGSEAWMFGGAIKGARRDRTMSYINSTCPTRRPFTGCASTLRILRQRAGTTRPIC